MKTKYMSRKFIVAVCGLGLALVALVLNNNIVALAGIGLAGCFIIGESIVDKAGTIKQSRAQQIVVNENVSRETSKEDK